MSNYNIKQSIDHVVRFTELDIAAVQRGIELLIKEGVIRREGDNFITDFKSNRLVGLYSYYRATLGDNLAKMFSHTSASKTA